MNLEDQRIADAGNKLASILQEVEGKVEIAMIPGPGGDMPHPGFLLDMIMKLKMQQCQMFLKLTFLDAITSALIQDKDEPEEYVAGVLNQTADVIKNTYEEHQKKSKLVLPPSNNRFKNMGAGDGLFGNRG